MKVKVKVLSAGAARSLLSSLSADFSREGLEIDATFATAGAILDQVNPASTGDVIILPSSNIAGLESGGLVVSGTVREIGSVATGIAVRKDETVPDIRTSVALKATLQAADAIFLPDPQTATAGSHLVNVMNEIGLGPEIRARFRSFPNGQAAMTALAVTCDVPRAIGCSQATEILATPGVVYVGPLPADYQQSTEYAATIGRSANDRAPARRVIEIFTSPAARARREELGFVTD